MNPSRPQPARRWWVAIILSLLCTVWSMLYLGRGRRAIAYGLVFLLGVAGDIFLAYTRLWPRSTEFLPLATTVWVVGIFDSYRIGKRSGDPFFGPWYSRWDGMLSVVGIIALALVGYRAFLFEPFKIPIASMSPTLLVGDRIFVYKLPYGNYDVLGLKLPFSRTLGEKDRPRKGDVVVFRWPSNPSIIYIERVLGVPGDKIAFEDEKLLVNDEELPATLVGNYEYRDSQLELQNAKLYSEILGDHRHSILHSHPLKLPKGEVNVPEGHYFVVGDNRDRASDSRYWGLVPEQSILGRPLFIWWSRDEGDKNEVRWERIGMRVE